MKRAIREAYEAAADVFQAAGFTTTLQYGTGKGHAMCVAAKREMVIRLPLPGSPASGDEAGARLAAHSARRRLRRLTLTETP